MKKEIIEIAEELKRDTITLKEAQEKLLLLFGVIGRLYDIVDKDGNIMPRHYSGRARTEMETVRMLNKLNDGGEGKPYTSIRVQ